MIHAGEGSIINIGSGAGMRGMADLIAYSTSKWALRGLTRSAALDLAKYNVRVNCICPGVVDSPMARARGAMGVSIPIGRTADPEEIAPFVLVLASGSGSYATGTEIVIDGGRSA
jgi:3alpha(or 20beta)-hydroxysteroid dehydrogenase